MSQKDTLLALQNRLAERVAHAERQPRGQSWLAVDAMGQGFLLPLGQTSEIFEVGQLVTLPHTQPWFMGVVNLRGNICTVVDLATLAGLRPRFEGGPQEQARLVALGAGGAAPTAIHTALWVDKLEGLRHEADLPPVAPSEDGPRQAQPAFVGPLRRDADGRRWQELDLTALAREPGFMAIAA